MTVAPRPQLGPLAAIEPAAWTDAIRDIAERPAAAARSLLQAGGKRWIASSRISARCRARARALRRRRRAAADDAPRRRDRERRDRASAPTRSPSRRSRAPGRRRRDDPARGHAARRADDARGARGARALARGRGAESLNGETLKLDGGFSLTRKPRPAPSAAVEEWLVEQEWRGPRARQPEPREVVGQAAVALAGMVGDGRDEARPGRARRARR